MREREDVHFESNTKNDTHDLKQIWQKMIANWYWFGFCAVFGLIIAYGYLKTTTPVYRINAKVLISDEQKGAGSMKETTMLSDLSGLLGTKSTVDNEAEILKTRTLMEQVVLALNAHVTYYRGTRFKNVEIYPAPFHVTTLSLADSLEPQDFVLTPIDSERVFIKCEQFEDTLRYDMPIDIPYTGRIAVSRDSSVPYEYDEYHFGITRFDNRVADFMNRLTVEVTNKLVTVIDLRFEYPLKKKGEDVVNTLIDKYVQSNLQDKNTIADSTIAFIENRLLFVGHELGDVEGNIQSFKQQSQLADLATQSELLLQNSSEYIKQLAEVETQLNVLNGMEGYLKDTNARVLPSSVIPQDIVFSGLVERYNTLLLDRDRQLLSATPNNPYIQNLDGQIANLRQDMLANLASTRRNLNITRNDLLKKTNQLESQIRNVPATERTYLDLTRQQQIKQELYIFLLQKREETAISKTANISNSRVIDAPKASPNPISPKRMITLALGLITGLVVPFGIIYLRSLLNTKVTTKEDITQRTRTPIIGEVSHNATKYTLLVSPDSRSPIAEQFRSLRTNLSFYLKEPHQKTILLTSSMSGEGKSFAALNLAMVLAISGKKVVVMEMDLRKPNLSVKLAIDNSFGFSNYVISPHIQPIDIVKPSSIHDNLHIISSGPIPPNPAELILSERTRDLFKVLRDTYDFIIIDAPPVGLVTDAQLLAPYADMTIYLVRQGVTYKSQLAIPEELYRGKRMKQLGLLVNDIKSNSHYGYGYGYNYGYGYGDYGQDTKNNRWWRWIRGRN